jgi:trimeric autotransporter adhesin
MKQLFAVALCIIAFAAAQSQNIAINNDGSLPHASAMLDIKNPNKGLLIPRINLVSDLDITTIANPRLSLLIYNTNAAVTDGEGYYFWNGTKWSKFATRSNLANLAWSTTGNTGTNAAADFIGTTDNNALVFKTNNIESGRISPALNSIFFGQNTGLVTTGLNNVFIGHQSATINTTGHDNASVGNDAMIRNTNGQNNTAIGNSAMDNNTTGDYNVAVGFDAMKSNETGDDNIAIGAFAGPTNNTNLFNTICIGHSADVTTSNTAVIGNSSTTKWSFGWATTAAGHALEVGTTSANGNAAYLTSGGTWTNTSDINKKEDFSNLNSNELLQKIFQLSIQRWKYKGTNEYHIGPTAQEFYKLFNVGTDDKGISTVDPAGIALAAIQEQQRIIEKQNERILLLEKRIETLEKK